MKEKLFRNGPGRATTSTVVSFVVIENNPYPMEISEGLLYGYSITLLWKGKINVHIESSCALPESFQGGQNDPMDVCQHALNNSGTSMKGYKDPKGNRNGLVNMSAVKGKASIKGKLHFILHNRLIYSIESLIYIS